MFFDYAKETGAKVAVYRFPNLMGHSRPKYNSAVSTFCWAVANDEPFTVNDRYIELELLYIDDLVEGMFDLLEEKEAHCEFEGVETVADENGRYCYVPVTHKVTLGEIVDLLEEFRACFADRFVLTVMNKKMVDAKDFIKKENGGILLSEEGRRKVLSIWLQKKHETLTHPFLQEKTEWGLLPYIQAMLLARYIRGDMEAYPPFFWK